MSLKKMSSNIKNSAGAGTILKYELLASTPLRSDTKNFVEMSERNTAPIILLICSHA